jgi:hypothetical protein
MMERRIPVIGWTSGWVKIRVQNKLIDRAKMINEDQGIANRPTELQQNQVQ